MPTVAPVPVSPTPFATPSAFAATPATVGGTPISDSMAVAMGAFDKPTGAHLGMHIFVADKGDYYDISDGLPQNAQ